MTSRPPTIPETTKLGPDMAVLQATMRRMAEPRSDEVPILSAYLDARPEAHGERPYARAELIILRDRLGDVLETHAPHSRARRSLEADRERLDRLLAGDVLASVEGLGVIAADGLGLWEAVTTAEPFRTDVAAGPIADLYQLALATAADEPAIVALVDVHATRLFTWRRGTLTERPGPEEGPEEHRRHDQGGWAQARYQRHIDEQDRRFARVAADAIAKMAQRERATSIVIGAEERASSVLLPLLPDRVRALVADVRHISMHATRDDVLAEVGPLLAALREERARDVADRAIAGWRARELGAVGAEVVGRQLEAGAVAELVVVPGVVDGMDRWQRAELLRHAILTDATIASVADHEPLAREGGIAATLRFRI